MASIGTSNEAMIYLYANNILNFKPVHHHTNPNIVFLYFRTIDEALIIKQLLDIKQFRNTFKNKESKYINNNQVIRQSKCSTLSKDSTLCKYQEKCTRKDCQFVHQTCTNEFLNTLIEKNVENSSQKSVEEKVKDFIILYNY